MLPDKYARHSSRVTAWLESKHSMSLKKTREGGWIPTPPRRTVALIFAALCVSKKWEGSQTLFRVVYSTGIHVWSHPTLKCVQRGLDEGRAEEGVVLARMS